MGWSSFETNIRDAWTQAQSTILVICNVTPDMMAALSESAAMLIDTSTNLLW